MQQNINIIKTSTLSSEQINDINNLFNECRDYDRLTSSLTLPDENSVCEDELFFLYYEDCRLLSFLSMFAADESFVEVYALTRPANRKNGLFTSLLYRAYTETDFIKDRDFLYLSDQKSSDCQTAYNKLGFNLSYSEYIMTKHAPFDLNHNGALSIKETADYISIKQLYDKIFDTADEYTDLYISQAQNDSQTKTYIFHINETVIGMMHLTDRGNGNIYLWSFGLLPEYRGRKLGHAMLSELFSYISGIYNTISLQVSSANLPAFRLYRKNGFEITSQVSYYTGNYSDII